MSRYENLLKEIQKCTPNSIMEIGVYDGEHSKAMIQLAKRFANGIITYYGFDLFEDITPEVILEENSKQKIFNEKDIYNKLYNTGANVFLHRGFTKDTLPKFKPIAPVDFVFIDGGHSVKTIKNDWFYVQKLMHKETVVLFDDYYRNRSDLGCKTVIEDLSPEFLVEYLEPIDKFQKPGWVQYTQIVKVTLG